MRYALGNCTLDTASRRLTTGEQDVHLSPKAFDVLRLLVDARPRVVTRPEIMQALWPDANVVDANLPVLVGELRAALGDRSSASSIVRTHHTVGYSFIADVRETHSAADPRRPVDGHVYLLHSGGTQNCARRRAELDRQGSILRRGNLKDPSVSKYMPAITIDQRGAQITDLQSKNGNHRPRTAPVTNPTHLWTATRSASAPSSCSSSSTSSSTPAPPRSSSSRAFTAFL